MESQNTYIVLKVLYESSPRLEWRLYIVKRKEKQA